MRYVLAYRDDRIVSTPELELMPAANDNHRLSHPDRAVRCAVGHTPDLSGTDGWHLQRFVAAYARGALDDVY